MSMRSTGIGLANNYDMMLVRLIDEFKDYIPPDLAHFNKGKLLLSKLGSCISDALRSAENTPIKKES